MSEQARSAFVGADYHNRYFARKLPRLPDRYLRSRPPSDLAERAHVLVHYELPDWEAPDSTVVRLALPRPLVPRDSVAITFQWEARPSIPPRRQGRRGRSFDFNTFSSELFSNITVRKTASADVEEGSLGATVSKSPSSYPQASRDRVSCPAGRSAAARTRPWCRPGR